VSQTGIEWADRVWNPVSGCSPVSAGCRNCYAERMAKRLAGRCGYPADDPFRVTVHTDKLEAPLHWRKPGRVFVNSMSDLFHPDVPDDVIQQIFTTMALANGTYMILTKRPHRMRDLLTERSFQEGVTYVECDYGAGYLPWPLPNVWLGTSIEDQPTTDERVPELLLTPAAVHFVSYEPALARVSLNTPMPGAPVNGIYPSWYIQSGLDWVICGRETGPGARPCDRRWVDQIVTQCRDAGVPIFVKPPFADEFPELNIQQFPEVRA
jgi:protein gp37